MEDFKYFKYGSPYYKVDEQYADLCNDLGRAIVKGSVLASKIQELIDGITDV